MDFFRYDSEPTWANCALGMAAELGTIAAFAACLYTLSRFGILP